MTGCLWGRESWHADVSSTAFTGAQKTAARRVKEANCGEMASARSDLAELIVRNTPIMGVYAERGGHCGVTCGHGKSCRNLKDCHTLLS